MPVRCSCDGSREVGLFWSEVLAWPLVWDQDEETAIQSPAGGAKVTWSGPPLMARPERDRLRLELAVTDGSDLSTEVGRLVGLGARHRSGPERDGRGRGDVVRRVLMTDLDGNEFGVTLA